MTFDINKAVETACARRRLRKCQVAQRLGYVRKYLSQLPGNPGVLTVERIAAAMDYKLSEFIALGE